LWFGNFDRLFWIGSGTAVKILSLARRVFEGSREQDDERITNEGFTTSSTAGGSHPQ